MISILTATEADIPNIVLSINKAYRGESSKRGWTHELNLLSGQLRIDEQHLTDIIKSTDQIFFLAKIDQRVVGTMQLRRDDRKLYLGLLSVDPYMQDQGIGRLLLNAADEYALTHHFRLIYMVVISERKELIAWYSRRGYAIVGEKKPFEAHPKFGTPIKDLYLVELRKEINQTSN